MEASPHPLRFRHRRLAGSRLGYACAARTAPTVRASGQQARKKRQAWKSIARLLKDYLGSRSSLTPCVWVLAKMMCGKSSCVLLRCQALRARKTVAPLLSSAILGFMLDAIGFQEGSTTQTPEVSEGLGWIMCIGVILAIGTGLFIFTRSKMTRADVQAAMDKLEQQENQNIEVSDIQTTITEAQTE